MNGSQLATVLIVGIIGLVTIGVSWSISFRWKWTHLNKHDDIRENEE